MERTQEQWREMLSKAGLQVIGVYLAADGVSEGIIEAEASAQWAEEREDFP